jgi:nucleotidyltransferase AbiEii toxin of type IV toxin-antitoxin system
MGGRVTEGITPAQRGALAELSPILDESTYLAGGVAIAMELHHRVSFDLDLFVGHDFDADRLVERLAPILPSLRVVGRAPGTLHLEVAGVPVSLLSYRYPLLAPTRIVSGLPVPVASLEDLACMKVSAIAGRGAAKDFWDLVELLQRGVAGGELSPLLDLYRRKFPVDDVGHAIRSLAYFADADEAALPRGLSREHWNAIKQEMARRVKAL